MDFAEFLSTELNNEQQKAVRHAKGPLLVIAGAGSGKTRVITSRIINLILTEKVTPTSIIALTFTNKAAQEMRERVQKSIGIPATPFKNNSFFIGTFHSYCLRLLKKNAHILKLDHFSILDGDDQISMLKKLVDAHCPKKIQPRQALYQISTLKNNLLNQQETLIDPTVQELYNLYEHEKRLSNCLDFDDLLIKALELFSSKNFKTAHQNHIRHVLVDEYQDTNVVQNELLKEMCLDKKKFIIDSLCAVGDEDQSIYSWRGATIDNMLNFKKDFPGTTLIKIEQNYRSVKPILEAANHIIKHNQNRHPKKLWSTREGSNNILELTCMSGFQEADMIAASASLLQQKNELQNCAVLYRTHFQSRLIEEALIKKSIPYKIIGGIQFYERKEIKDLLAYLRLLINPFDRIALFRILNCPPRRLGDKFAEQFQKAWEQEPFQTFTDIAQKLLEDLKPQQKSNLEDFINIFSSIDLSFSPAHAINHMSKKCGYLTYLKEEYEPQEAEARIQNIQELINAARYFEEQGLETTEQFLQEIALLQDKINQENNTNERLTLMTIHAAKGLEFDTIILAGLEEGLLPSSKSLENESNIEEERRLLYVGITRARKKLILLQAGYRHTFGSMTYQQPSRFLKELPNTGIQREDCSYWKECQTIQFLRSFFGIIAPEQSIQTFGPAKKFKAASKKDLHSYPSTSSGRAQPLVLSEAEASGRAQPLVLSEAEASGRAQPLVLSEAEASGRAQPLVLSEAEASERAQPLVLSEAEASGRAQSLVLSEIEVSAQPSRESHFSIQHSSNKNFNHQKINFSAKHNTPINNDLKKNSNYPHNSINTKLKTHNDALVLSLSKDTSTSMCFQKCEYSWKKHQPVTHKTFGVGVIQDVEKRPDGSTHITAKFKNGIKKIDSKFLEAV